MKILTIRFANLNSLAGEWSIDFTAPDFVASGIFAIVGTTGSGKSTILDAISLALYGRTPRLKLISKSTNEIMSRHTGYCFSEVEFASVRGRFRSHWSQHRARRSAAGELQQPRHEIVDAKDDRVLASKIKDVGTLVTEVTGMNFDQFTRSMLLAQGDFSKFLQAGSDDRAPILEQITGTEIYSRISQQVHIQKTEEENNLKALEQALAAFNLMTEEEEFECRKNLKHLNQKALDLNNTLARNSECINWLKMVQNLSALTDRHSKAYQITNQKWQEAAPQREKLQRGEAAQLLATPYSQLSQLKTLQKDELAAADKTAKERDTSLHLLHEARKRLAKCQEQMADATEIKLTSDKIISKVVQLDLLCEQHQKEFTALQREIGNDEKNLVSLQSENQELSTSLSDIRHKQLELDDYFCKHSHEADLVENLAGIKERAAAYSTLSKKVDNLAEQHRKLAVDLQAVNTRVATENKEQEKLNIQITQHQKSIEKFDRELAQLTDQDIGELYRLAQKQVNSNTTLAETIKTLSQLEECRDITAQMELENSAAVEKRDLLQKNDRIEEATFKLLYENVKKQEEIVIFAAKVEAYEKERRKLQNGVPCPLCGSTDHPFSDTEDMIPDQAKEQLFADRKHLERSDERRKKLQTDLKILNHAIGLNQKSQENNKTLALRLTDELSKLCKRLHIKEEPTLPQLKEMAVTRAFAYQQNQNIINQVEQITSARKDSERSLEQARQFHSSAEKRAQQSQFDLQIIHDRMTEVIIQQSNLQKEQDAALMHLETLISHYSSHSLTPLNINTVMNHLEGKRDDWKKSVAAHQELETSRQGLVAHQSRTQFSIAHIIKQKNKKCERLQPLKKELDVLRKKRTALFGDKDPTQETQMLLTEIELAEKRLHHCRLEVTQHEKTVSTLTERASNLLLTSDKRAKRIIEENKLFTDQLIKAGFESTTDFHTALLSTDELQRLQLFLDQLKQQKTAALALFNNTKLNLQTEQHKQLTHSSLETLEAEQTEQNSKLSEIQQQLGAELNRLTHQEQGERERTNKREQLRLQQVEFGHWAKLHELIGSADGKKFRNFAQGLTFELMIVHANRTLARMSERYLLSRDKNHPLELNVIDNYQAGELRSTANLSGGESFIISLALALGLASMAGKNIQVDSLFLDEGFGSLDEESLEIALETLSCLQQEGKIIGIISHVPLLKERISVQLQLTASTTGRSRVEGPGVSHLA
ncbi:MAG: AAA family ATPase [Desulforhopalus sp.]